MRVKFPSRRRFLQDVGLGAATATVTAASWSRVYGANEKLRLASVGVGGKGWSDLNGVAASPNVLVVSLCDIDDTEKHMGRAAEKFPAAARFTDWRRLLDKPKGFDAVTVSTPDHMHAPVALAAMAVGKHVFCQKPLTHTVNEARQMRLAAKKYGVVTQMGNQIQAHEAYRTAVNLVRGGIIGKVKEVHSWQTNTMRWLTVEDRPGAKTRCRTRFTGGTTGWAPLPLGRTRRRFTTRGTGAHGRTSPTASSATSAATSSTRCSWRWD